MLPDTPCIPYLIGCPDGRRYTYPPVGNSFRSGARPCLFPGCRIGSLSGRDFIIPHIDESSSGRSSAQSSSSSACCGSRAFSPEFPASLSKKKTDLFAVYDVSLKNLSLRPLSGLAISHGPVPFGGTFDALRSASGCSIFTKIVGCSANLGPGETTSFRIVYRVTNATYCRVASVLNAVNVAWSSADRGSVAPPVAASVRCEVRSGSLSDAQAKTVGSPPVAAGTNGIAGSSASTGMKMPVTGATEHFFMKPGRPDFILMHRDDASLRLSFAPVFWFPCAIILVLALLRKMKFRKTIISLVLAGMLPVFQSLVEQAIAQTPPPQANISIQTTGPVTIVRGSVAVYVVTAGNAGPDTATNVVITDQIPSDLDYVSYSASEGVTCAVLPGAAQVQCQVGSLQNGLTTTINLNFIVRTIQTCTSSVATTNTATVQTSASDPVSTNNVAQMTSTLTCPVINMSADLAVTLNGPTSVIRGTNATYTASVTNSGPTSAQSASLQIPLSSDFAFVSTNGATCSVSDRTFTCALGIMNSGQTLAITLTYSVPTISDCTAAPTTQMTAIVSSATTDPNAANNTSQMTTTIHCDGGTVNLSVYKTDNRSTVNVNETLHYNIIIRNDSSTRANNVFVSDQVPYDLRILAVSDGGSINGQNVTWHSITVEANSSRILTVDAQVRSDVTSRTVIRNTVYVRGQTSSDDTMVTNQNDNHPPYYLSYNDNPPYRPYDYPPPYDPPPYDPPPHPPVYESPSQPPIEEQPVILPRTGIVGGSFYVSRSDTNNVTAGAIKAPEATARGNVSTVVVITLLLMFALGSVAATRMFMGGL